MRRAPTGRVSVGGHVQSPATFRPLPVSYYHRRPTRV